MKRENLLPLISLFFLVLIAHLNSLRNEFLNWDDTAYVVNNPYIQGISLGNLKALVLNYYVGEWFPLQMVSYLLDYQLWGMNVIGYHITNILFHLGSVVLIFLIFQMIGYSRSESFIGASLFAVFPPSVEAIAWVSQRKSVMNMFFMLLSLYCYIRSSLYSSLFFFILSLFSKSTSIPMPGLIVFYESVIKETFTFRSLISGIKKALPFLIISIIFLLIFIHGQREVNVARNFDLKIIYEAFVIFLISPFYWFTSRIFLPVNLNSFYPPMSLSTITNKEIMMSSILWLFVLFPVIVFSWKNRLRFFWLTAYLVAVLPGSIFAAVVLPARVTETSSGGGDRHLYYLCLTFIGFLCTGLDSLLRLWKRYIYPLFLFFIASYVLLTIQRNNVWRSDLSLWTDSVKKVPDYFFNQLKAGEAYRLEFERTGKPEYIVKAIEHYKKSIALNPDIAKTHYGLAHALEQNGNYKEALLHYERTTELLRSDSPYPFRDMARVYYKLKDYEKAIRSYERAIEIDPDSYILWNEKGGIELEAKRFNDAISSLERSLFLNYNQYEIHRKLGAIYLKEKRDKVSALMHFEESFKQNPHQEDVDVLAQTIMRLKKELKNADEER